MTRLELKRAIEAVQRHYQAGRMSQDEFEAARMLLESQATEALVVDSTAPPDAKKTAPYPALSPEMSQLPDVVTRELRKPSSASQPPPLTASQHSLAMSRIPSSVPYHGPTHSRTSPAPPSRPTLPLDETNHAHDTPLVAQPFGFSAGPETQQHDLSELVSALKDLSQLHKAGVLSEQEYHETKTPILHKIRGTFAHALKERGASYPEILARILTK